MNYLTPFSYYRAPQFVHQLADAINHACQTQVKIMQVCGTHTWNYRRHGLAALLTPNLTLVPGPGCPVCVTDQRDIDWVIELAGEKQNTLVTFGDLMRVPGSTTSLAETRSHGADIRIVLSPLEALDIALAEPSRRIILLAIGFETTAPAVAAALQSASHLGLANFSVAVLLKRLIPALRYLFAGEKPDGLLCPGHVAAVMGQQEFAFLAQEFRLPSAISGFEPGDMLLALLDLTHQSQAGHARLTNAYPRLVSKHGNLAARSIITATFKPALSRWRGLGNLPATGYELVDTLQRFALYPPVSTTPHSTGSSCLCDLVILGKRTPGACPNFGKGCTPDTPLGPCMVSQEGTCAAHYYYPETASPLNHQIKKWGD